MAITEGVYTEAFCAHLVLYAARDETWTYWSYTERVLCILGNFCLLYAAQDKTWTYWFIRRVGNVCDGPLGNVFIVLSVTAGACLARRLLAI